MPALCTFLFTMFLMVIVTSRGSAADVRLGLPTLRLGALPSAAAFSELVPKLLVVGAAAHPPASSAASNSLTAPDLTLRADPAVRRAQRKIAGAGYGLAAGLGMVVGGVVLAAQTRPNNWEFSSGVCYDSQQGEKRALYIATGVMAAGLGLSSGMLAWLIRMRRAHPELRPTRLKRGLQALVGIGFAGVTTTVLMAMTIGCASS
jgi:hypothetical protein